MSEHTGTEQTGAIEKLGGDVAESNAPFAPELGESRPSIAALRDDLALVNEIPLYYIDHEDAASDHGEEFTLDQHLAFGRLTDALPALLDEVEDLRDEVADLRRMVIGRGAH